MRQRSMHRFAPTLPRRLKRASMFLAFALLAGCTDPDVARKALDAQGFTAIEITGWRFFGCGKHEFTTGFAATNMRGMRVTGVVCSGFFKGSTIRFD